MKDLKNIVVEFWELFFPLLIRVALSLIIFFAIYKGEENPLLNILTTCLKNFVGNSKVFLASIGLENFFGLYLLISLIVISLAFNAILRLLESIFRVSIYWYEIGFMEPYGVARLVHYLPNVKDISELELRIKSTHSSAIKENKNQLGEMEKWLSDKLTSLDKYLNILVFEFLFTIIVTIMFYKEILIPLSVLIVSLIILSIFLLLSKYAIEVKSHFASVIYKIELIYTETKEYVDSDNIRSKISEFTEQYKKNPKWWGIRIILVEDVKATIMNLGSVKFKR